MMPPAITFERARELFDLVNRRLCCPASAGAPCIPFLYPDDGCWGRAHEMCRLMIAAGASPEKIWIFGNLRVTTSNNPACYVSWGWHVAPSLQVLVGGAPQSYVIDPSLLGGPAPLATWAGLQGDPGAALVPTAASVFYRNRTG